MSAARAAGALLAASALLTSCTASTTASTTHPTSTASSSEYQFNGALVSPVITLSAADRADRFRESTGGTTTLAALQHDRLMLVYFGYTHCPDVCPTTMADLGIALRKLPSIVAARTQVVFVTSDPARDTPLVMKAWLANFDPALPTPFVGLTADLTQIDAVGRSLGVPLSAPVKEPNGSYAVEHGAQTLAFVAGKAHVVWLAGTTPADYASDIETLAAQVSTS